MRMSTSQAGPSHDRPRGLNPLAPLLAELGADEMAARAAALRQLRLLGEPQLASGVEALWRGEARPLLELGDARALPAVLTALSRGPGPVRRAAAFVLGSLGGAAAVEPL